MNFRDPGVLQKMTSFQPVNARAYYEYLPSSDHRCGDIWRGLPSIGLLGNNETVKGLIITPACDLGNFKTETLTYLPVISVRSYFTTIGFLPSLRREILERMNSAGVVSRVNWPVPGYEPPSIKDLQKEIDVIEEEIRQSGKSSKDSSVSHLRRAISGLKVAISCVDKCYCCSVLDELSNLLGSKWSGMKKDIITNSYRSDIHFLPSDGQGLDAIGICDHSVVLLRYPITMPSEIFTAAQNLIQEVWPEKMRSYETIFPAARHFLSEHPVKILSLKSAFLSDLLSRFISLYGRIGSPDFSIASIEKMTKEFG